MKLPQWGGPPGPRSAPWPTFSIVQGFPWRSKKPAGGPTADRGVHPTVLALLLILPALLPAQVAKFRVRESAGLRRFNIPVRTSIRTDGTPLALLENGKPIPAQFTPRGDGTVEIDFNTSHAPWEVREYRVEPGTGPAATNNMSIAQANGVFAVRAGLQYDVPENLLGLLSQVTTGKFSYLRPGSQGLVLNYKDDVEFRAGGTGHWNVPIKATVTKRGPLVCGLRFESMEGLRGDRSVKSVVEMEFPRSKSWVEVRWTVDDPNRWVTAMMADLNLLMEGGPTVVDFGASNTVYVGLRPGQRAVLSASMPTEPGSPLWFVHLGSDIYASGVRARAEGWAHIMDPQRSTAVAVDGFGRESNDHIEVSADGRLVIRREIVRGNERFLHFWIHFVSSPVQIGAATSPQAILNPLTVEWK
jgi:hypothetical protein